MDQEGLKGLKGIRKITVLTAYDYQMARILDRGGIDIILVGDSLGMVVLGYADTKQVTMRDMIRHTEAVAKGVERALVVADLSIGSYGTVEDALDNANRLLVAGAQVVKSKATTPK
jgi:3-methyl-2-oxobutanoate hydroxymethyltransferase